MKASVQPIADHLKLIAHMFLKDGDQWRSRAFSKVAGELETPVYRKGIEIKNGKLVETIPGVGKAIKDVIEEFVAGGTSRKLEKLKEKMPNEVFERFDAKTCKTKVNKLLRPLTLMGIDWGYAGSMRRGSPTVKDVDVIVCLKNESEKAKVKKVIAEAGLEADVRNGNEKIGVSIPVKAQGRSFTLDLNFTTPESRGAMYLYFTGPKAFNIAMRGEAKARKMRLNQNGLFKGQKKLAGETEEEMFEAMGWEYLEPGDRS